MTRESGGNGRCLRMCTEGERRDLLGAASWSPAGPTLERMTFPSGIPIDELDPGIRPQDDLFRHVNGRWLARTTIPADRARDSTFRAGGQRFFLSWARTWKQKTRNEEAIRLLAIDPHSPGEFRCNQIVRNLDEFYDAFDVGAADELWLEPAARVRIW